MIKFIKSNIITIIIYSIIKCHIDPSNDYDILNIFFLLMNYLLFLNNRIN